MRADPRLLEPIGATSFLCPGGQSIALPPTSRSRLSGGGSGGGPSQVRTDRPTALSLF